ncbi:hypothetical protein Nepgr_014264 [Nepenthes gracilis]|uniref:Protein EMBRYONIC FLOWER 1-like n=1 Tax=Nepenthes gracilis TaxID=150966 RepID=A0AAD3SJ99_NEPGR|nr:hypothetical protein Nepgr_014264 [Nepenthes gracilis]
MAVNHTGITAAVRETTLFQIEVKRKSFHRFCLASVSSVKLRPADYFMCLSISKQNPTISRFSEVLGSWTLMVSDRLNMRSVVEVDNQHRSDPNILSKTTETHIHIDSISVDITSDKKNETAEWCNHFSIRGYVAEVRNRDGKKCFPFSSDVEDKNSMEKTYELPPLDIPKFRWWQCSGCLQGSGSERTTQELLVLPNDCNNGSKSRATSSRKLIEADGPKLPLKDIEQTLKLNIHKASTSDSSDNRICASFCSEQQGKGFGNSLADNMNHDILQPTSDAAQVDVLVQDFQSDNSAASKLKCKEIVDTQFQKSNNGNGHLPEPYLLGRKASADGQQRDVLAIEEVVVAGQAGIATEGHLIPFPDLNKYDDMTLENDEIVVINNPCDEDDDDFSGAHWRKTRKTRLLSELLGLKEDRNTENLRNDVASAFDFQDRLTRKVLLSVAQGEALVNENSSLQLTGQKKRRKTLNNDGFVLLASGDSSNRTKKIRTIDVDKENTIQRIETFDSGTDYGASAETVSQSLVKGHYKHALERNFDIEKKGKKRKVDDKGSSLVSRQKVTPKENQDKTSADGVHDSATDVNRRMDQFAISHATEKKTGRRFISSLKKKKMSQIRKGQTQMIPLKILNPGECLSARKDAEFPVISCNHAQIQPVNDASAGRLMHHFPNRYLSVGTDSTYLSSTQDQLCLPSVQQEHILLDDHSLGKCAENRNIGDSSTHSSAAVAAPFVEGCFDVDRDRSICKQSNLKGKQKFIPEVEGGRPLMQHMVSPGMHKKGMATEVQGHMRDIDINTIPINIKVPEQRSSDDIPMDIVELMAKYQHERRGDGAKDKLFSFGPNSYAKRAGPIGSSGSSSSYGIRSPGMSNWWHEHFPWTQRPQYSNDRNGIIQAVDNVVSFKQNLSLGPFPEMNRTHFNISHPNEAYLQYGDQVSSNPRFSSLRLTSHNWNDNTSAQRYPHGFIQGTESFNRCLASSQTNHGVHVGPSVNPNCPSLGLCNSGIFPQHPDKHKINQDQQLFNMNGGMQRKQTKNLLRSWDTKLTEYSSAVQLLNLMHTGGTRPTTTPYNVDGNLEFLKWPTFHPDRQYNQLAAAQNFGAYKTGAILRNPPLHLNGGRTSFAEKPHPCYSSIPTVGAFTSPFRVDVGSGNHSAFTSTLSFTSGDPRFVENYHLSVEGGDFNRRHQSVSAKGEAIASASSSIIPPLHITKDLTNHNPLETRHGARTILPTPSTESCMINRNPAEFNNQNLARKYMIGPESLRPVKRTYVKSAGSRQTGKKPEKILKLSDRK